MTYLIVSNPPHGTAGDMQALSVLLGLSVADTRMKLAQTAPEILFCEQDPEKSQALHDSLTAQGVRCGVISQADLHKFPEPQFADRFDLKETGLFWQTTGVDVGMSYEFPLVVIISDLQQGSDYQMHRERERLKKKKKGSVESSLSRTQVELLAESASSLASQEGEKAGQVIAVNLFEKRRFSEQARIDFFSGRDAQLRRISLFVRELRFAEVLEKKGKSSAENLQNFLAELKGRCTDFHLDQSLCDIKYRLPVVPGLDLKALIPVIRGVSMQQELAIRLSFLSRQFETRGI